MAGEMHPDSSATSSNQPYQPQPAPDPSTLAQYPQYAYDAQLKYPHANHISQYPDPQAAQDHGLPIPLTAPEVQHHSHSMLQEDSVDTTGQLAPPGVKPKVTATLWEDEGTICFQVDVKGTCVARREGKSTAPTS